MLAAVASMLWYLYKIYHLGKKNNELNMVVREMSELLDVLQAKQITPKKNSQPPSNDFHNMLSGDLYDPGILSTLLTVIVTKYGDLRIGLMDFVKLSDADYVSIYVDTETNDILLSPNSSLSADDPTQLMNFTKTDDTTYN
tara:strand:- start:8179 stop:8601 length:423 start_codon:yes stop_codon:yes gene_type:complete